MRGRCDKPLSEALTDAAERLRARLVRRIEGIAPEKKRRRRKAKRRLFVWF